MNPRLFTSTNDDIDEHLSSKLTINNYFKKIHQYMVANSKLFGSAHHEEFLKIQTLVNSKSFKKLSNEIYTYYLIDNIESRVVSLTLGCYLNSNRSEDRIVASRFDNLELFHEELYRIRSFSEAREALDYEDCLRLTLFTDPTSMYLKYLLAESYLVNQMHFIQFVNKQYNTAATADKPTTTTTTTEKPCTDTISKKNKSILKLFNQYYLKHLQAFAIAHDQLLPKVNVLDKDFISDTPSPNNHRIC